MRTFDPPSRKRPAAPPLAAASLVADWKRQSNALRLLRAFLGVTFLYAGIQKLADPNFFRAGTPTYVGGQIQAFAQGSPIAPLLRLADRFPTLSGLGIALVEIAIGLGVLLGVGALVAAVCGCGINTILWLSATWHVHPFFLGSDSIYAVAWAAFGLSLWDQRIQAARSRSSRRSRNSRQAATVMERRAFLRGGLVAGGTLTFALFARVLSLFGTIAPASGGLSAAAGPSTPSAASTTPSTSSPSAVRGKVIGSLNKLQVGQPIGFATADGTPGALFRLSKDKVVAYSRICTHAGCTVGYDPSTRVLFCPCHGAEFDPLHGARVLAGPAPVPLPKIKVAIDPATQNVVLPS